LRGFSDSGTTVWLIVLSRHLYSLVGRPDSRFIPAPRKQNQDENGSTHLCRRSASKTFA
jgi:hypothetical protein